MMLMLEYWLELYLGVISVVVRIIQEYMPKFLQGYVQKTRFDLLLNMPSCNSL